MAEIVLEGRVADRDTIARFIDPYSRCIGVSDAVVIVSSMAQQDVIKEGAALCLAAKDECFPTTRGWLSED